MKEEAEMFTWIGYPFYLLIINIGGLEKLAVITVLLPLRVSSINRVLSPVSRMTMCVGCGADSYRLGADIKETLKMMLLCIDRKNYFS